MNVTVRLARMHDLEPARAVWEAANIARAMPPSRQRNQRVAEKLVDPSAVVFVACIEDSVVGMMQAEPGRFADGLKLIDNFGHISMLFVDPERQGTGIGRRILSTLSEEAPRLGWHCLSLWTRRSNSAACGLYQSLGFRVTADTQCLPDNSTIDRWQLDLYVAD